MIGAGLHGNGRHWYSLEPEERVTAMEVSSTHGIRFVRHFPDSFVNSTGGSAKLLSASHLSFARSQSAFS